MNKLSSFLRPISLLGLLAIAHFGYGQVPPAPRLLAATPRLTTGKALLSRRPAIDLRAPVAPLVPQANATPGWVSLAGALPTGAPLTAALLGPDATPVASRTWRGLTAGQVQLELNLRSVPAGTYVLCLSQDGRQWRQPLAVQ